jgi:hypothetical protein
VLTLQSPLNFCSFLWSFLRMGDWSLRLSFVFNRHPGVPLSYFNIIRSEKTTWGSNTNSQSDAKLKLDSNTFSMSINIVIRFNIVIQLSNDNSRRYSCIWIEEMIMVPISEWHLTTGMGVNQTDKSETRKTLPNDNWFLVPNIRY